MKNRFQKLISALLCLILLFSAASVMISAAETAELSVDGDTDSLPLPTVETLAATTTQKNAISRGTVLKVGSDYMLSAGVRTPIFQSADGEAFGKPFKHAGLVYVPLAILAGAAGATVTPQGDGLSFDIARADGTHLALAIFDDRVSGGAEIQLSGDAIYGVADNCGDHYPLIPLDDVKKLFPSIHIFYDEMGLITVTDQAVSLDRTNSSDLNYMMELQRQFVFNFISGEEYYDKVNKNTNGFTHPYIYANQEQFDFINDVYTGETADEVYRSWICDYMETIERTYNKFTTLPRVPAITADPDDFDFTKKPDYYELLAFEITNPLDCGIQEGKWFKDDFDYGQFPVLVDGLAEQPLGYKGKHWNGGYEYSTGRCGHSLTYAEYIQQLALGYQITREDRFAVLAYEMTVSLMKWDHWAQGHYLNCAQTAGTLGSVYDWLYNIWNEMGYDTNEVAQAIYEKCVFYGYVVSINLDDPSDYPSGFTTNVYFDEEVHDRPSTYGTTEYNMQSINWNAVCTSGLVVGMLSIIGAEDKEGVDKISTGTEIDFTYTNGHGVLQGGRDPIVTSQKNPHYEGKNILYWLIESNLRTLANKGLIQYAPDGSFIEGPGYWSYATNNLTEMLWAIDSATGDDQGWHDFWGIDTTFYFAIKTEYPSDERPYKYSYWNFHDCSPSHQSTYMFFYAAEMIDDPALAAIRIDQLKNGKAYNLYDILGYKQDFLNLNIDEIELDRDYRMLSINGVTTRSDWERGCIFTGLIGNKNSDTAHGQVDSGMFTYASSNYTWFVDMGADNYDVIGYFHSSSLPNTEYRYRYYRNNTEGANTICMTSQPDSLPSGQSTAGGYYLVHSEYESADNGMIAVLDGSNAFGSYASSAYRGLLFTNDRETVIIQDEMTFNGAQSVCWIGHTRVAFNDILISDDGRVAHMRKVMGGKTLYLRVSIVSPDTTLKFTKTTAGYADEELKITEEDSFLLEKTHRPGWSESQGGEEESERTGFYRLIIKAENVTAFNCAVVIEEVDSLSNEKETGYTWSKMTEWSLDTVYRQPTEDKEEDEDSDDTADAITIGSIASNAKYANQLLTNGYAYGMRQVDFFKTLCKIKIALAIYPPESFASRDPIVAGYNTYLELKAGYDAYLDHANGIGAVAHRLTKGFGGIEKPKDIPMPTPSGSPDFNFSFTFDS